MPHSDKPRIPSSEIFPDETLEEMDASRTQEIPKVVMEERASMTKEGTQTVEIPAYVQEFVQEAERRAKEMQDKIEEQKTLTAQLMEKYGITDEQIQEATPNLEPLRKTPLDKTDIEAMFDDYSGLTELEHKRIKLLFTIQEVGLRHSSMNRILDTTETPEEQGTAILDALPATPENLVSPELYLRIQEAAKKREDGSIAPEELQAITEDFLSEKETLHDFYRKSVAELNDIFVKMSEIKNQIKMLKEHRLKESSSETLLENEEDLESASPSA
ncbi:hypothetical protein KKH43_06535 [Patescibacteria group bacterium]|nr:hypothetical protein [Patescibacteria group bacterium]